MAQELDRLTAEVSEMSGVVDSAMVLLEELSDLIRESAGDPAALGQLADQLDAKANELANAVAANSPQAPVPEPAPEPAPEPNPELATPVEGEEPVVE